ncbi:MAG TPA: ester cyclase [Anaerolineae bacterium]|nr:ester cyclase [Anaerolineae bacterium]
MSIETDREIAKRFLFTHNQANYLEAFDEYLAPDCIVHEYLPGLPDAMNRAMYEQYIAGFRAALPDVENHLEDIFVDGERVAMRWTGGGAHTGADLMQIPASGKPVTAHGIYILRIRDGKIVEVWNHWDNLNVVAQLRG